MAAAPAAVASAVFLATVAVIVLRLVDEAVAGLAGALAAVALVSGYTASRAFHFIDWDVMAILLGMWILTGYMTEAGVAEAIVSWVSSRVGEYRVFILSLALIAGFVSMFVDNVLVILLFGSIALEAARRAGGNPALAVILVGLAANYMGTALLMGDLPPQLLHSIAGYEFLDFIWWRGRPGSFIVLTASFLATMAVMYALFLRGEPRTPVEPVGAEARVKRGPLAVSASVFAATVAAMALRPLLGVPLGYITLSGAAAMALAAEAARRLGHEDYPSFEKVASDVEWRALLFYASLFALVGSLQYSGALASLASHLRSLIAGGGARAFAASYWLAALPSTVVEHDAMLLSLLYTVRDAAALAGVDPHPLYWALAWGATLASNLTTAAAPALYVALVIAERGGRRVGPLEFLRYSSAFVAAGLALTFLVALPLYAPLTH
ncbi:MAG: SLC13 family permease [Desulfurococcales archaeon]|nr:SLC13 family permease [Desulfurococcales archaeon]